MDYNTELTSLQEQVNQFDTTSPIIQTLDGSDEQVPVSTRNIWNNKYFEYGLYIGIPIIIIGLLAFISPSFTQEDTVDEEGDESTQTNLVKVLTWGVMISVPLVVGVYIFMRKKKKMS